MLDLNHLRYFIAIAQHGSMSKAARALKVSQPTLTVAIRNLEEGLNTTLFLRDSKGVSLTESGRALLDGTDDIFALIERTEQRILGLEGEEVGQFTVGCHESLGAYFLPGFLKHFLEAAPRIEVSLYNATSENVRDAVIQRKIHFGLIVNPLPHPDLVLVDLFRDAVEVLVSSTESSIEDLEAAYERIRKGPLIFAGRVSQCQDLLGRFAADGLVPSRTLNCGDLEIVKSLALGGIGVAMLPRRVADYGHSAQLRRLHKDLPSFPDSIYLIYRGDLHRTRGARRLKDALVEYGRNLPPLDELDRTQN